MIFAPRSWPSRPGLPTRMRTFLAAFFAAVPLPFAVAMRTSSLAPRFQNIAGSV